MNENLKDMIMYLDELKNHVVELKGKKKSKKAKDTKSSKKEDEDNSKGKIKRVFPDTLDKTYTVIKKLEERIAKKENDIETRELNKQVALNTSKLNYMDPRITVSFCKKFEVPIEKVFPRSVLDKFPWAMYTGLDYKF